MTGQHVGAQSDSLVADEGLQAARAAQQAAREAIKPRSRQKAYRLGDGDICPVNPEHGPMFVLSAKGGPATQWCPDQSHDGTSRALWPLHTFEAAVKAYKPVPAEAGSTAPAQVIDGAPGTPPVMWSPNQTPMKNVTPAAAPALTPGAKVAPSKQRQSAKGRLNPKLGARTPAAASSSPDEMLIDLSAMLEDLDA